MFKVMNHQSKVGFRSLQVCIYTTAPKELRLIAARGSAQGEGINLKMSGVSLEKVGSKVCAVVSSCNWAKTCTITDIVSLGWKTGSSPLIIALCDLWRNPVAMHLYFAECFLYVRWVFPAALGSSRRRRGSVCLTTAPWASSWRSGWASPWSTARCSTHT